MLSFNWSSRMTMKMRNSQVQRGVIVQLMMQWWSCYNHSPSGRLLGVEHDYLEVFVSAGCIPQVIYTPPHVGGCGGGGLVLPPQGFGGAHRPRLGGPRVSGPPAGVSGATPPKLKTDVKLPCKSIVISSQSRSFIRQMI